MGWLRNFQLRDFYICLLLANVLVLAFKWHRQDVTFRPYFFIILLALVTQASGFYWNNFDLPGAAYLNYTIYGTGEVLFFGWYFLLILNRRTSLFITGIIFTLYILFRLTQIVLDPVSITQESWATNAVVGAFILFFSLAYFYQLIKEDDLTSLNYQPNFWLSALNMIYYSGFALVSIGISYTVRRGSAESKVVSHVSHYLNLLLYIGYLIIFLCFPRKRALSTP